MLKGVIRKDTFDRVRVSNKIIPDIVPAMNEAITNLQINEGEGK